MTTYEQIEAQVRKLWRDHAANVDSTTVGWAATEADEDQRDCFYDQNVYFLDPHTGCPVALGWVGDCDGETAEIWVFDNNGNEVLFGKLPIDEKLYIEG